MYVPIDELVRRVHASSAQLVLALNGGSRALAKLLEVPGGSRTLLEATVPYSENALAAWLGSRPEQFCSPRTACAMAVVAFGRALRYVAAESAAAGIASSASLASDRPKRGPHRAHVALQTSARSACSSLEFVKGARSRAEEEQIVARMVLNVVADACGIDERLELPLLPEEHIEVQEVTAPAAWQALFLGRVEATRTCSTGAVQESEQRQGIVFPGAFNPLHPGHRRMAEIAAETLGEPVEHELSIRNVDKPALDFLEIERRLAQLPPECPVWLTRAATFVEKARLFPGATFIVGADTLMRIVDLRYYAGREEMQAALDEITACGCRFLVFCRAGDRGLIRLADIPLPPEFREACREVPPEEFRDDVSSTALRSLDRAAEDSSHRSA